jgi:hypothetical protein
MNVTTNSISITGLTGLTSYDVYVQSDCGSATSPWTAAHTFTTACPTFMAPYTQDFESVNAGIAGGDYGNCWEGSTTTEPNWHTEDATGASENSTGTGPFYDNTSYGTSGGMYMYLETSGGSLGSTSYLTGPNIDVSGLNNPALFFSYHMFGADMGTLEVEISEDNGATWTNIWSLSGQQQTAGGDPWTQAILPLSVTSNVIKMRFVGIRGNGFTSDMSLDDVMVDEGPSCFPPVSFAATSINGYGATMVWSSMETSFDVEYGPTGYAQGTGTVVSATDTFAVVSGLMPTTTYDAYVRTNCSGAMSSWVGPIIFTTTVSCPAPSFLGGVVTSNSVSIYVSGGGGAVDYNYAIMPQGSTPTAADIMSATGDTISVTGLMDNTPYTFYVRDSCGVGDVSTWVSINFSTACNAAVAPYMQDFDAWPTNTQGPFDCWALSNDNVSGGPYWRSNVGGTGSSGTGPIAGYGGSGGYVFLETSANTYSGDSATVRSPSVDISNLANPELSFYYHMHGAIMGTMKVFAESANGVTLLWSANGQQQAVQSDPWLKATVSLAGLAMAGEDTVQFVFQGNRLPVVTGYEGDMAMDEFRVDEASACADPSMDVVSALTATGATVSWVSGDAAATSWDVEYGATGFAMGSGTTVTVNDTFADITGLTPQTTYDYYVSEACVNVAGNSNAISGTFTTRCGLASMPYLEDFDAWPPACWDIDGGSWTPVHYGGDYMEGSFWTQSTGQAEAVSQAIAIGSDAEVSYRWSHYYMTAYPLDQVLLLVREVGTMGWDTISNLVGPSFSSPGAGSQVPSADADFVTETILLDPSYTGTTVEFRFDLVTDYGPDVFIDDFAVTSAIPPVQCFPVDSIVDVNSDRGIFDVYFGAMPVADAWQVEYKAADDATWRSKTVGPNQGVQRINTTPTFGDTIEVRMAYETAGTWTYGCVSTFFVDCRPIAASMVVQRPARCAADSVLVRAGYAGGYGAVSVMWSNGSTNKRTYADQGEKLIVTLTDAAGCSVTDSITAPTLDNTAIPENYTLTKDNATSFTGSWTAPTLPTGATLIGYRFAYRLRGDISYTTLPATTNLSATVDFTGSGLPAGNYEFVVFTRYRDANNVAINSNYTCIEAKGYTGVGAKNEGANSADGSTMNFSIYPNPANERVFVAAEEGAEVSLLDIRGRAITKAVVSGAEVSFDMSNLAQGVYMIRIETDSDTITEQVVKN